MMESLGDVFALKTERQQIRHVIGSVRTKIETRTVKRIDEPGGIAHHRPTVTANFFAMIRQHRKRVHVAFDHFCCAEDFAADGVVQNVRVQSLSQSRSLWKFEDATVVNDTGADIASLQRNDPNPPAASEKMVRGPLASSSTRVRIIGKTFAPFVAVPFFNAAKPCPHRVDGVLGIRAKISELSREHRRAACSIDNPTASGRPFGSIDDSVYSLSMAAV